MHKYSELHIKLKEKGFPQNLHIGDWVYLPDMNDYLRVEANNIIPEHYVKAPKLTTMMAELDQYDYTLVHKRIDKDRERWFLDCGDIHIEDENVNIALIQLWLIKKG